MTDRIQRLTFFVLTIVILYTIFVLKFVAKKPVAGPLIDPVLVFLTSIGFYQLLVRLIFQLVGRVHWLLKLYWGRMFLDGFWSYTYTLDGKDDGTVYFGVWRFEQTLYDTCIVGFGLSDNFIARSRVRSVTDVISNTGINEVINIRSDSIDSSNDYYSRTRMYFELNKNKLFRYPTRMRGTTVVYGGPLNGRVCNNVFIKHEDAKNEDDVIAELRCAFAKSGKMEPGAKLRAHTGECYLTVVQLENGSDSDPVKSAGG